MTTIVTIASIAKIIMMTTMTQKDIEKNGEDTAYLCVSIAAVVWCIAASELRIPLVYRPAGTDGAGARTHACTPA